MSWSASDLWREPALICLVALEGYRQEETVCGRCFSKICIFLGTLLSSNSLQ